MKYLQTIFFLLFINVLCVSAHEYKIPFELVHNNIIINSNVNGVNCKLMYDTGARSFIINSTFAQKNTITAAEAFRGNLKGKFGQMEIDIKYILIEELNVIAGDIYDGIIGIDFFKDFVVKIDYQNQLISLSDSYEVENDYTKLEANHLLRNPDFLYWFTVRGEIQLSEGKVIEGNFLIDTGSARSISLTNKISKKLLDDETLKKVSTKGNTTSFIGFKEPTYLKVPHFEIGDFILTDYIVDCNLDVNKKTSQAIDGILGSKFLQNFTIIIDFKKSSIYFKKNTAPKEVISNTFYSDGFQLKDHRKSGEGILISSILTASTMTNLPIKLGDEILEVDDVPVSEIEFKKIEAMKNELGRKIHYKVKRKRKIFFVETQVKNIFE